MPRVQKTAWSPACHVAGRIPHPHRHLLAKEAIERPGGQEDLIHANNESLVGDRHR